MYSSKNTKKNLKQSKDQTLQQEQLLVIQWSQEFIDLCGEKNK